MKKKKNRQFIAVLHNMIETEEDTIMLWTHSGSAFKIYEKSPNLSNAIGRHFRHNNYTSFQRQLNIYNFSKSQTGEFAGSFFHPTFSRTNFSNFVKEVGLNLSDPDSCSTQSPTTTSKKRGTNPQALKSKAAKRGLTPSSPDSCSTQSPTTTSKKRGTNPQALKSKAAKKARLPKPKSKAEFTQTTQTHTHIENNNLDTTGGYVSVDDDELLVMNHHQQQESESCAAASLLMPLSPASFQSPSDIFTTNNYSTGGSFGFGFGNNHRRSQSFGSNLCPSPIVLAGGGGGTSMAPPLPTITTPSLTPSLPLSRNNVCSLNRMNHLSIGASGGNLSVTSFELGNISNTTTVTDLSTSTMSSMDNIAELFDNKSQGGEEAMEAAKAAVDEVVDVEGVRTRTRGARLKRK